LIPAQILTLVGEMKTEIVGKAVKLVKKQKIRFSSPANPVRNLLVIYVTQIHHLVQVVLRV
jgi:hypothetical protein